MDASGFAAKTTGCDWDLWANWRTYWRKVWRKQGYTQFNGVHGKAQIKRRRGSRKTLEFFEKNRELLRSKVH